MKSTHIINHRKRLIDAMKQINSITSSDPLALFVLDDNNEMVGTLTDGDIRRALINHASVENLVKSCMHQNFKYLRNNPVDNVRYIRQLRQDNIKLIPILDDGNHIVDILNLAITRTKLPIDAVLMAGGKGVRLRPLTEKIPKPLLPIGDKPIIDYNIERMLSFGINHISVTVNYLGDQIEDHFSKPINGTIISCVKEPKYLGTIGSVKFIKKFYNDTILVMNSDLFTNIDYEDFYLHFTESNAEMSVAAVPYSVSVPFGIFDLDGRFIKGLVEKPKYNYYANAGIYLIKRDVLDLIPNGTFYNATDLIETLIEKGKTVIRYPLNGTWIDIGTHQEYQKAQDLVKHLTSNLD